MPGLHVEAEDCALQAWWAVGWLAPDGFAPDLAQRSFHGKATPAHYGPKPGAWWWRPGPKAEEGLALLAELAPGGAWDRGSGVL